MSDLVTLKLGRIFKTLRKDVERLRDDILTDAKHILKRTEEASIRQRWYDTGATLASLRERIITDGNKKTYLLYPTATNKGAPYPMFGEYGTGRAGAVTGKPAVRGYSYGRGAGMAARRYSRIAVQTAQPLVARMAVAQTRRFAANMTT